MFLSDLDRDMASGAAPMVLPRGSACGGSFLAVMQQPIVQNDAQDSIRCAERVVAVSGEPASVDADLRLSFFALQGKFCQVPRGGDSKRPAKKKAPAVA